MSTPPRFTTTRFWRLFPAGMRRRWWLFRPFDVVARHWPVLRRRRGVLVVRMDGIGDMVLFRRSLDRYAAAFGVDHDDVTVLGCDSWRGIADEVFHGYRVVAINEHAFARRPFYRFRVALMVRRLAPAVVVCDSYFRRALMADSLVWLAGAPRRVVSVPYVNEKVRPEFTWYMSQFDEVVDTGPYPTHEVVRHARFVAAVAGDETAPEPPGIAWRDGRHAFADVGGDYAVLTPGSNEPGRRWPFARYVDLAERLLDSGLCVAVVGKPDERYDPEALMRLTERDGVTDHTGRTSLADLLDLMNHARLVVSNDTGPAHLAVALGAPTVVIVGGGHFGCFVPYPEGVRPANARFVHHEMDCYHCFWLCHKRDDPRDSFPCVAAVPFDDVWRACGDLLAAGPNRSGSAT